MKRNSESDVTKGDCVRPLSSEEPGYPTGTGHSSESQEADLSEFGAFRFWRNPLPNIEDDLQDLLASNVSFIDYWIMNLKHLHLWHF